MAESPAHPIGFDGVDDLLTPRGTPPIPTATDPWSTGREPHRPPLVWRPCRFLNEPETNTTTPPRPDSQSAAKVLTELLCGDERVGITRSPAASTLRRRSHGCTNGAPSRVPTQPISVSPTSPTSARCPSEPRSTAPSWPGWLTARPNWCAKASSRSPCGAFHIKTAGRTYFNSTRSAGRHPERCWCGRWPTTASTSGGDGSTYKGNDIRRFYRYGLLVNPNLRIYKPWLDPTFVDELGGRQGMSEFLQANNLPYRDPTEKAYSTDANI